MHPSFTIQPRIAKSLVLVIAATLLVACGEKKEAVANVDPVFKPTATIQEIMTSIIDPNVDYVWNSVATITTAAGTEERAPHTDEEWKLVRQHAITLLEASNLLIIEGRHVAGEGATTSSHAVELSPAEIEQGIAAHRQAFIQHAHALHDATQLAIKAIDSKDVAELEKVGGTIDQACEACHVQFWYPNDKRPTSVPAVKAETKP